MQEACRYVGGMLVVVMEGSFGEMDARLLHTTRLACVRVTRLRAPQRIQGTRGLRCG